MILAKYFWSSLIPDNTSGGISGISNSVIGVKWGFRGSLLTSFRSFPRGPDHFSPDKDLPSSFSINFRNGNSAMCRLHTIHTTLWSQLCSRMVMIPFSQPVLRLVESTARHWMFWVSTPSSSILVLKESATIRAFFRMSSVGLTFGVKFEKYLPSGASLEALTRT